MNADLIKLQKLRSYHHEGMLLQLAGTHGKDVAEAAAIGDASGVFHALVRLVGARKSTMIAFAIGDGVADRLEPEALWPLLEGPTPAPPVPSYSAGGFSEHEAWFRREYTAPLWAWMVSVAAATALGALLAVIVFAEWLGVS